MDAAEDGRIENSEPQAAMSKVQTPPVLTPLQRLTSHPRLFFPYLFQSISVSSWVITCPGSARLVEGIQPRCQIL